VKADGKSHTFCIFGGGRGWGVAAPLASAYD